MALRIRRTARVILLNDQDEILMIQHADTAPANPKQPERLTYWVPPGGGVEDEETYEAGAIRELMEETGVRVENLEGCIFKQALDLKYGIELVTSREHFFLARITGRPVPVRYKIAPEENIADFRWWPLQEIAGSEEIFYPEGLIDLIEHVLKSL